MRTKKMRVKNTGCITIINYIVTMVCCGYSFLFGFFEIFELITQSLNTIANVVLFLTGFHYDRFLDYGNFRLTPENTGYFASLRILRSLNEMKILFHDENEIRS